MADSSLEASNLQHILNDHKTTISAATASFISTTCGFPLDSVKSRLQVKRYSSVLDCIRKTFEAEGIPGFFRGVTIPLVTITAVRTTSFTIYSRTKAELKKCPVMNQDTLRNTALLGFSGGAASGMILSVGTSAFEFVKINQQLQYLLAIRKGIAFAPKGTIAGFLDLWKQGGFFGLYRGFRLHAARDILGTGFYFGLYDSLTWMLKRQRNDKDGRLPIPYTFISGSLSGILSWSLIYPIDIVKTKVQRNALAGEPYQTPSSIFKRLLAGGVTKLYRGLGISATRSIFTHGIMWSILETVSTNIDRYTGLG